MITRRDMLAATGGFAALATGGAASQPTTAAAQERIASMQIARVGSQPSSKGPTEYFTVFVAAFRQGLAEAGYVEGRNVAIEFRWAESSRTTASAGRRSGPPSGGRDRGNRTNRLGTCGESRHLNDSNRTGEWP
jgi:hypothetical protein